MAKNSNLNERLINFATLITGIAEDLPQTLAGKHLAGQLIKSGTAPALHFGEAQDSESRDDFIHKMKIALKELRETYNNLYIIEKLRWLQPEKIREALDENNQLISIFVRSITTARHNRK